MSNNCKYIEIHSASIGAVLACSKCDTLKIEIGNMMALISPSSFDAIHLDFTERITHYTFDENSIKPLYICLNAGNLFLKLTPKEFLELVELFGIAKHIMVAQTHINSIA